ncbi:MAG: uroporphyrinogen-III synthase [Armatimonadetes bacterium]|nr:uroporphyrinogen-III synthase [Anaerolineae bacterium]
MTLAGKRIVITRATHQYAELADLLVQAHAQPLAYPAIQIAPVPDTSALDAALTAAQQGSFDWVVFTSVNAVQAAAARLQSLGLPKALPVQIGAVGAATAAAVTAHLGVSAHYIPQQVDAAHLLATLPIRAGSRVLLPQSALASADVARQLSESGAEVVVVTAYTVIVGQGGVHLPALVAQHSIDAITFTSGSTVEYCLARYTSEGGSLSDLRAVPLACFGKSAEIALSAAGLSPVITTHTHTLTAFITDLTDYFHVTADAAFRVTYN